MKPARSSPLAGEDLHPLAWCRAAIGALILLRTTPLLAPLDIWFLRDAVPLLGWPQAAWGVATMPAKVIAALCVVRTIAAALFMLGIQTRAAGIACAVSGYAIIFQQPFGFFFTVHLYYQAAFLLAFTDAGAVFALRPSPARAPRSSYRLMRLFIASVYLWAGAFKLRPDWLDGRALELFHHPHAISGWLADLLMRTPGSRAVLASTVAVLEVSLGPTLLWSRTRRVALVAAYLFHLGLELTAHPDLLGWGMMALLLCFLPSALPKTEAQAAS